MCPSKSDSGIETIQEQKVRVQKPKLFKVFLLNDDYTTMDFVVMILESIFRKTPAEAVQIMLHVHSRGKGECGVFVKEIAEAKIEAVHRKAMERGFPLRCILEEA